MMGNYEGKPEFGRKIKMSKGKNVEKKMGKMPKIKCRKIKMSKGKNIER